MKFIVAETLRFGNGVHKKGPPGDVRRAAQAGGILESFLDYLTPGAAVL